MSIIFNLQTAPKSKKEKKAWQVAPNLFASFRYAWAGIIYAVSTQRNFRIHLIVALVGLSLGIMLRITALEAAVVAVTVSAVLVMELMNTALESVVDLTVGQTYHELAKIAKDCAAGAVLISAIAALLVAGFIYLPRLLVLFNMGIA
ncbi:MAG: diacylglycerol kinase family protein [Symploca sp. SIO2G7]|nr:diacylglycerol kinase family protein [Symploca sp. SIO2G7]